METSTAIHSHDPHDPHGHGDHAEHHDLGFWRTYVFSVDHKVIGIQYAITGLLFLFLGFCLMMMMRWQLAYDGKPLPFFGPLLARFVKNGGMDAGGVPGVMTPDFYNSLGAMHGTIMVFLGIVPIAFGAFGNYLVPLQIGAPDMAFPRLNMASYHAYWVGGVLMLSSFFCPTGPPKSGWTSYSPLADLMDKQAGLIFNGQTIWILAMVILISSSLLGSVNIITTVIQLRAPGLTWMRMPFFTWTQLITAFLLLLAFPPLEAGSFMQLMDRVFGTSFFLPHGEVFNNQLVNVSGGGSPLLWQHLFWFLAHPEVYVLILPALGIVAEVITNNTRRPMWGYKAGIYAVMGIGFLSFVVWAHHMYLTGMGRVVSTFFQTTTILISVPSVIILTCLLLSLWGGSIRFTVPMLFATAFLPEFGIGGLTGIPLAFTSTDLFLHDTYYVIAHFHYIVAPGTIFAIFAGIYYWYPKASGRMMNQFWGKVHFWLSLICINMIFMPMFLQGMAGMHRRGFDGGKTYTLSAPALHWNVTIAHAAWGLGLVQFIFIFNFFWSMKFGRKVGANPWNATTLEWSAPSPPPHGNFVGPIAAYRGPYEYSVPGHPVDFVPQADPQGPRTDAGALGH
ncbi:MAG TPA: cbb3-type cytochrome c oxidase subunit I [Chthoniobacteraceae bacterium]|jgi:cytochrome c oxidase subunit 1|nr:cbb3-type cytochrome c oxidase subunit I [Chthoniobacteraceae bacterium]